MFAKVVETEEFGKKDKFKATLTICDIDTNIP